MADTEQPDYTSLTVQLLSAYVANNTVASEDLATLIQSTRAALIAETVPAEPETIEHVPAVSVRKSIASREHILSLIDGRPYKTLKRHLATHGLTPADYRARYGLPETYPMVAQAYSDQRRAVAQKLGLGQRGTQARVAAAAAATQAKPATPPVKAKASVAPKADVEKAAKPAAAKKKASAKVPASTPVVAEAPKPEAKKAARVASKPKAEVTAKAAPAAAESAKPKSAAAKAPAAPKAPRKKLGIKAESGIGS
jgi:predicted transcriptional regulator